MDILHGSLGACSRLRLQGDPWKLRRSLETQNRRAWFITNFRVSIGVHTGVPWTTQVCKRDNCLLGCFNRLWEVILHTCGARYIPGFTDIIFGVLFIPEGVVKALTAEVVVAPHNSNSLNIIVLVSSYFFSLSLISFRAEGRAIETTGALPERYWSATLALPWRYHSGAPVVVSAQFRYISDDPLSVTGVHGLVAARKLVASAPFRFVSDDLPSVSGCWRQSCPDAKTSSFGTISIRRVCREDPYSGRRVS